MENNQREIREQSKQDVARAGDLVALDTYRRNIGRSKTTFWRYRKKGWLPTVNILGRLYLTESGIREFEAAARAGELARDPSVCAVAKNRNSIGRSDKWRAAA